MVLGFWVGSRALEVWRRRFAVEARSLGRGTSGRDAGRS